MQKLNNHSLFLLSLNRFCYDVGRIIFRKYHLTVNERNTLIILSNIEINSIKELSAYLSISKTNTSKVLNLLEKKSLVLRIFGKTDKRFIQLLLTEQGKLISNQVEDKINELLRERLSTIPGELGESVRKFIDEKEELINYYSFKQQNQK